LPRGMADGNGSDRIPPIGDPERLFHPWDGRWMEAEEERPEALIHRGEQDQHRREGRVDVPVRDGPPRFVPVLPFLVLLRIAVEGSACPRSNVRTIWRRRTTSPNSTAATSGAWVAALPWPRRDDARVWLPERRGEDLDALRLPSPPGAWLRRRRRGSPSTPSR